jgi:hypothetical protein
MSLSLCVCVCVCVRACVYTHIYLEHTAEESPVLKEAVSFRLCLLQPPLSLRAGRANIASARARLPLHLTLLFLQGDFAFFCLLLGLARLHASAVEMSAQGRNQLLRPLRARVQRSSYVAVVFSLDLLVECQHLNAVK